MASSAAYSFRGRKCPFTLACCSLFTWFITFIPLILKKKKKSVFNLINFCGERDNLWNYVQILDCMWQEDDLLWFICTKHHGNFIMFYYVFDYCTLAKNIDLAPFLHLVFMLKMVHESGFCCFTLIFKLLIFLILFYLYTGFKYFAPLETWNRCASFWLASHFEGSYWDTISRRTDQGWEHIINLK